jgi:hypothetical protein
MATPTLPWGTESVDPPDHVVPESRSPAPGSVDASGMKRCGEHRRIAIMGSGPVDANLHQPCHSDRRMINLPSPSRDAAGVWQGRLAERAMHIRTHPEPGGTLRPCLVTLTCLVLASVAPYFT